MRPPLLGLALLLATASAPGPAAAQDALDPEARLEEARLAFERGRRAFARGRFEAALGHFEASHRLTASPDLLYNIALTLDRLGRGPEAIDRYAQYLALRPDAPERPYVEERMAALRAPPPPRGDGAGAEGAATPDPAEGRGEVSPDATEGGGDAPAAAPAAAPTADDDADTAGRRGGPGAAPWVLIGAGVLAAGGGAALLVVGADAQAEPALTPAGAVLVGLGGAAVVGGLVWWLVAGSAEGPDADRARLVPLLAPGHAGLRVDGVF